MKDQAENLRKMIQQKKNNSDSSSRVESAQNKVDSARIYTVTSGKGGVGKSNFTANLALALQEQGEKVILFDADLGMANLDVILGVTPNYNLNHVISGKKTLPEIILEGPNGISLIPGGSGVEELANLSRYQLNNLIDSWSELEEEYDIILIDTGAGLSNIVINFILAADETLVISTSEPTSITDAYGVVKVLSNHNQNLDIKLVINQASDKEGTKIANRLTKTAQEFLDLNVDLLGVLPEDRSVIKAVKKRKPFLIEYPKSKVAKKIRTLGAELIGKEQEESKGFTGFLKDVFGFSK
ncbi:MinD/ParA family protein [Halanaerobacter jeridensis]|uniref:Flagellar biosynthesis protein FlhG n=1 Tax=Halanaerobacter jeridensis TaxID=706427 RepID=A0A938XPY3_9FIRM|nr:MinD/ParA family protein [Halanaerobacter jeridensis]MBM7555359.1 flagellar biosynthesis protein FlhG [Halanaerobacter jeridensis]